MGHFFITYIQVSTEMDSTMTLMKTNMDEFMVTFKNGCENMKENNNKLIFSTLNMLSDLAKELSQKIKEATSENKSSKTPREIFTQPHVKSALKMFSDQLDWFNTSLEDFMREHNITASNNENQTKKTRTSNFSFRSKK